MIKKILIANRGEIALRIMKACKSLNIQTVAVYSEADQESDFVNYADESYLIGPPPVNESYLDVDKIIEVAKSANVDAIHPANDFLGEIGTFVKLCVAIIIFLFGLLYLFMDRMAIRFSSKN